MAEHDDESVLQVLTELQNPYEGWQRGDVTKEQYDSQCVFYGWNYHPSMLLLCQVLRVGGVSILVHDWAHIFIISGLFQIQMHYLLVSLNVASAQHVKNLDRFARRWTWPKHLKNVGKLFDAKRLDLSKGQFSCDAHEALQIFQVVVIFLMLLPDGVCPDAIASFVALSKVLRLLSCINSTPHTPEELRDAILGYLHAHQPACGETGWIPKHHLAMDLVREFTHFGLLLSLLTQERMHKVVKRWSRDRYTKVGFEKGIMQELTLDRLDKLQNHWWLKGMHPLVTPNRCSLNALRHKFPGAVDFETARQCRCNGVIVSSGDVAFITLHGERRLGEVWFFASVDGSENACVCRWDHVDDEVAPDAHTECLRKATSPHMWVPVETLLFSALFPDEGDSVIAALP